MPRQSAQEAARDPSEQPRPEKRDKSGQDRSVQPESYIARLRAHAIHEAEKKKFKWKTMGPAKVALPSPNNFLQKHSKEPKLAPRKKEQDNKKSCELSVPRRTYRPVIRIERNFINENAIAAIKGVPKEPRSFCVNTRQGDKYLLGPSGLAPKYITKKDYGVTPKYVTRRNVEIKKEKEEHEASVLENLKKSAMKHLTDEEKTNVLQALKKSWEETNREFQRLPLLIDTWGKRMRKQKLELKLKQLEHDIEILEKHKTVYIANE